jgi:hypothetical protein
MAAEKRSEPWLRPSQLQSWRDEGMIVLEGMFSPVELQAIRRPVIDPTDSRPASAASPFCSLPWHVFAVCISLPCPDSPGKMEWGGAD